MVDTTAHLVEEAIPELQARQGVLSLDPGTLSISLTFCIESGIERRTTRNERISTQERRNQAC